MAGHTAARVRRSRPAQLQAAAAAGGRGQIRDLARDRGGRSRGRAALPRPGTRLPAVVPAHPVAVGRGRTHAAVHEAARGRARVVKQCVPGPAPDPPRERVARDRPRRGAPGQGHRIMGGRRRQAGGSPRRPAPRGGRDRRAEGSPAGPVVRRHPEAVGRVGLQALHVVARAPRVRVRLLRVPFPVVRIPDLDPVAVDGRAAVLRRRVPVQLQLLGLDVLRLQRARDARHRDARGCGPAHVDRVAQVAHAQGLQVAVGVVPHLTVGLHRQPEVDLAPVGAVRAVLVDAHRPPDLEAHVGPRPVVLGQQQLGCAGAAVGVVVDRRAGAAEGAGDGVAAAFQVPAAAPVDLLVEVDAGGLDVAGPGRGGRHRQGLVRLPGHAGHVVADVAQVVDLAVVDIAHLAVGADRQVEGDPGRVGHGRAVLVDLGTTDGAGRGGGGAEARGQHELGLGVLARVVLDRGAGAAEVGGHGGAALGDGPASVGVRD